MGLGGFGPMALELKPSSDMGSVPQCKWQSLKRANRRRWNAYRVCCLLSVFTVSMKLLPALNPNSLDSRPDANREFSAAPCRILGRFRCTGLRSLPQILSLNPASAGTIARSLSLRASYSASSYRKFTFALLKDLVL